MVVDRHHSLANAVQTRRSDLPCAPKPRFPIKNCRLRDGNFIFRPPQRWKHGAAGSELIGPRISDDDQRRRRLERISQEEDVEMCALKSTRLSGCRHLLFVQSRTHAGQRDDRMAARLLKPLSASKIERVCATLLTYDAGKA